MKAIFKYKLKIGNGVAQTVMMPEGAAILSVQFVGPPQVAASGAVQPSILGEVCVYALVDDQELQRPHAFYVFGTGRALPDDFDICRIDHRYLGTAQQGPFVWHVFGGAIATE